MIDNTFLSRRLKQLGAKDTIIPGENSIPAEIIPITIENIYISNIQYQEMRNAVDAALNADEPIRPRLLKELFKTYSTIYYAQEHTP